MDASVLICCSSLQCAARNVLALFRGALAITPTPLWISFSVFEDCFKPLFSLKRSLSTPLAEKPLPLLQLMDSAGSKQLKGLQTSGSSCALSSCTSSVPLSLWSVMPAMPLPLNNGNAVASITVSSAAVGEGQEADACLLCNPWHAKDPLTLCFKKGSKSKSSLLLVTIYHLSKPGL